jgi:KDO2-lipid IV(A) lauroyltransferase
MSEGKSICAVLRLLARLPYSFVQGIGAGLGWLAGRIPNRHRRITERNIELCFPGLSRGERRRLTRRSLVETGKTLTESLYLWLGDEGRIKSLDQGASGWEHVEKAMTLGKGVIVISPHLGSWEYVGVYCAARYPMTCMYRPPRQAQFDTIVRQGRERTGMSIVPTNTKGIRALLQVLRKGEIVGILPDQDPRDSGGTFAPFFGIPANTMTLVSKLVSKTGAVPIFAFAERLPGSRGFHMHFIPAPEGTGDADDDRAARAINEGVETLVRMAPAQYQWSYKRFRTRPEGEPRVY